MIYKGYKFRRSHTIVQIEQPDPTKQNYVAFGKVYPEGKAVKTAIQTRYTWPSGASVFAKPIPVTGHSLTNMAYGKDGRIYLMYDGGFYTAKMRSAK